MQKTKSFYAIIPATVRYCEGLNANAKLLYGEITALCNEQGFCWANNHYFAELYQVDKRSISRWISDLENEGFISSEIDQSKGNSRKIFISDTYGQKSLKVRTKMSIGSGQKCPEGQDKNVYNNNTINNTINNTERETLALDFLNKNYPSRFETFLQQNKSQIKDFKKFEMDFNDTCDEEKLEFNDRVLFGRLGKYARNWIQNQNRYQGKEEDNAKPMYLRKVL